MQRLGTTINNLRTFSPKANTFKFCRQQRDFTAGIGFTIFFGVGLPAIPSLPLFLTLIFLFLQIDSGSIQSQVKLTFSPKQRAKPKTSAQKTGISMPHCVARLVWLLRVFSSGGDARSTHLNANKIKPFKARDATHSGAANDSNSPKVHRRESSLATV
jgi:hypothetical protein